MGVFGPPGSVFGVGVQILGLPDVNGDGRRDLLVAGDKCVWIFAGPGSAK